MARKILTFALFVFVLAVLAAPAPAQLIGRTVTVAKLPACNGAQQMALVTDATNATTLGAGGGSASVWVSCATGSWAIEEVAAVSDLTGYLPVNGTVAADVAVTVSGAGNDVELIAADDVILTPTDAITAVAGGAVTLTGTVGTVAIAASAGAVTVTATGATNDVTLSATDDVLVTPGDDFTVTPTAGSFTLNAVGAGEDGSLVVVDDLIASGTDFLPTFTGTAVLVAPATTFTASTSILATTPMLSVSGVYERKVTNVTTADDAAGTKPAIVIPITTDFATCTCNDATGCTASIAEPTVTSGYGRSLTIISIGSGNCEFADSAGVTEIGNALVLEPTSTATYVYANAAWHLTATTDNVP